MGTRAVAVALGLDVVVRVLRVLCGETIFDAGGRGERDIERVAESGRRGGGAPG